MRIKIGKIKESLKKTLRIVVFHPLLSCFLFFILAAVLGEVVYYNYVVLPSKIKMESTDNAFLLKDEKYQAILKIWKEQENRFNEASLKQLNDPFKQ
jgi:hypothetical protein